MIQNLPAILAIYSDFGIALLRVALGIILLAHGWPKIKDLKTTAVSFEGMGFRPGGLWGTIAAVVEFFGGVLLITGLFTRFTAFVVFGQFIVILIWRLRRRDPLVGGFELDLLMLVAALTILTLGPGAYALF
jgi:putative oxidoreductase